ncbi:MAG: V4R domain-containing protein [Candidatus Baldrarchaeia archaeon]
MSWRKVDKINVYGYTAALQAFVTYLMGSGLAAEEVVSTLKEFGRKIADALYDEFMSHVKVAPHTVTDLERMLNDFLNFIVGQIFDDISSERSDQRIVVRCRLRECKLCLDLESPSPDIPMCTMFAGAVERICEKIAKNLGMSRAKCDEVKCRAAGGDACEFVLELTP